MSIRYRLIFIMVCLSVFGVCLASGLAHAHGEANLKDAAVRQLTGLRRTRAYQIQSYFRTARNHVLSLSDDRMFVDAMQEFASAYSKLDSLPSDQAMCRGVGAWYDQAYLPGVLRFMTLTKPRADYLPVGTAAYWLQNQYVLPQEREVHSVQLDSDGAAYNRVNAKYDPSFRKLVEQFGYYDLLLVYPKDLRVIYSAAHNPDFGTSLSIGPYRDTALGGIVAHAMTSPDPEAVFVADYSRYTPVKGAPAAFLASPIFDGRSRVGAFVLQISSTTPLDSRRRAMHVHPTRCDRKAVGSLPRAFGILSRRDVDPAGAERATPLGRRLPPRSFARGRPQKRRGHGGASARR